MKTALVLGLALAANAYKTEQVETRVHIKGDNLNFKDLKDLQNLIPHGVKFDDELFRAPYDQEGHKLPYRPGVKYDDEFHVAPHDKDGRLPYRPHVMYDDQADDELATLPYREPFLKKIPFPKWELQSDDEFVFASGRFGALGSNNPGVVYLDNEADDELSLLRDLLKPQRLRPIDAALPLDDEFRVVENPNLRGGLDRRHTIILP